jgi:hypothetical protein
MRSIPIFTFFLLEQDGGPSMGYDCKNLHHLLARDAIPFGVEAAILRHPERTDNFSGSSDFFSLVTGSLW